MLELVPVFLRVYRLILSFTTEENVEAACDNNMTLRRVDDIFEIVDLLSGEILKMVLPRSQVVFYLELLLINIFPLSLKPANFLPLVITPVSVENV